MSAFFRNPAFFLPAIFIIASCFSGIVCLETGNYAFCRVLRFNPIATVASPYSFVPARPWNLNAWQVKIGLEDRNELKWSPHSTKLAGIHYRNLNAHWLLRPPHVFRESRALVYLFCDPGDLRKSLFPESARPKSAILRIMRDSEEDPLFKDVPCD